MPHTFISYSHKDRDYAFRLAETLERIGFLVWIDERIDYGSSWPDAIEQNINDCGPFIVIMTPRSKQSMWVINELTHAQAQGKHIFPLLLEGDGWFAVEGIQYVDVRDGSLPPARFYGELAKFGDQINIDDIKNVRPRKEDLRKAPSTKTPFPILPTKLNKIEQGITPTTSMGTLIRSYHLLDEITRRLLLVAPRIIFSEASDSNGLKLTVIEKELASYGYEGFGTYEEVYRGIAKFSAETALKGWLGSVDRFVNEGRIEFHPIIGEYSYSEWDVDPVDGGQLPNEGIQEYVDWEPYLSPFTAHLATHHTDKIILRYPGIRPVLECTLPEVTTINLPEILNRTPSFPSSFISQIENLRTTYADDKEFNNCLQTVQNETRHIVERLYSDLKRDPPSEKFAQRSEKGFDWQLAVYGVVKQGNTLQFRELTGELVAATPVYSNYLIRKIGMTRDGAYFLWEI